MDLSGTLRREDFVGETWILDTDTGERFQLVGEIPGALAGKRVKVSGHRSSAGFGFAMVGEVIEVRSIRAA